jgi:hypothetical protein
MPDRKVIDESHKISDRRGNGQLRREVWVDEQGCVTRYNLAYINHGLHQGDNGRVVGYDNQHGYHHRHYFGNVESIDLPLSNFEWVAWGRFVALRWGQGRAKPGCANP